MAAPALGTYKKTVSFERGRKVLDSTVNQIPVKVWEYVNRTKILFNDPTFDTKICFQLANEDAKERVTLDLSVSMGQMKDRLWIQINVENEKKLAAMGLSPAIILNPQFFEDLEITF